MNTIGERIKWLRKDKDMTQQEFSERLGIKRNTVAQYETGKNKPLDSVIALICSKFAVNESWLRTGEGEPYVQLSRQAEIARIVGSFMDASPEREALIVALAGATDEEIKAASALALRWAAELGIKKADGP